MAGSDLPCPACSNGTALQPWSLRKDEPCLGADACSACGGVWLNRPTLDTLLDEAARQAPADASNVERRTMSAAGKIVYRKCPVCAAAMQRKNFGAVSGIILDVCGAHGTFFDHEELPGVLAFVRSGGLALSARTAQAEQARNAKRVASSPLGQLGEMAGASSLHDTRAEGMVDLLSLASGILGD